MFSRETLALMEAAVDAIVVIDHRGRITSANDATCRTFGFRVDEMLGENVSILMDDGDRQAHDAYMRRHLDTGRKRIIGIGREVTGRRKDGTVFPLHLSVGRIAGDPPSFVGIMRDITTEHEALMALELERDRAKAFLELNDAILLQLDTGRRIREINARGSELLGAPVPELLGRDWTELARGDAERERARTMLDGALASNASREREFDAVDALGEPRRYYWRCIALRAADGTPAGWLCSGTDVTDRQRREEEARLAQDRLTRVARLATLGEMAAGIAHELNQPLTAITTYARACENYLLDPAPDMGELHEGLREINAEGLRAGEIIRRLRQIVRSDPTERCPSDLDALVSELEVILRADARAHDAVLRIGTIGGLPPVLIDPVQIQQVLLNLVRNAFEAVLANPPGDREVEIATVRATDGQVELRVSDNGPGIAPEVADQLFEPFCTTKRNGTGLGLAMSRTLVHAHGGTIEARPVQPRGACFRVTLPVGETIYA